MPSRSPGSSPSPVGPLAAWVLVQLGALAISAGEVPLSGDYPRPAERVALAQMLIVQLAVGGMLFAWLLRTWGATMLAIAAAWPFVQLAGLLAGARASVAIVVMLYVSAYLLVLRPWRSALRTDRAQLVATAIVTFAALGGPMLWYLHQEFAAGGTALRTRGELLGPIMGGLMLLSEPSALAPWLWLVGVGAVGVFTTLLPRIRQLIHRSSTTAPVDTVDNSGVKPPSVGNPPRNL